MKHPLYYLGWAALAGQLLSACGGADRDAKTAAEGPASGAPTLADSANMTTDSARMAKPNGVTVDGVAMTADKTIIQNAVQAKSMSTLVSAVQRAGLDGTLSGPGPYTVFAPTNAAFDKLPKGAMAGLTQPESKEKLKGLVTYHVVAGRLLAADFKDGQQLTTVNGQKLTFTVRGGKVQVGNGKDAPATIETADVISKNGVTHVLDGVVLPLEGK